MARRNQTSCRETPAGALVMPASPRPTTTARFVRASARRASIVLVEEIGVFVATAAGVMPGSGTWPGAPATPGGSRGAARSAPATMLARRRACKTPEAICTGISTFIVVRINLHYELRAWRLRHLRD